MSQITIKRGNTLRLSMLFRDLVTKAPQSMVGKTITTVIKTRSGVKLLGATVNAINAATGTFEIYAPPTETDKWPEGEANVTVDVAEGADLTSSQSFLLLVERR